MDFNHHLWGEVVADGPDYCHWGGRRQSQRLVSLLSANYKDRVLEVCCGRGGMLRLVSHDVSAYGVDLSGEAVGYARRQGLQAVQANALKLPFAGAAFTKLLSQDADAWMLDKKRLALELRRVAAPGALLIVQTYARSAKMPQYLIEETNRLLSRCGYTECEVPVLERMPAILESAGWKIESEATPHDLYARGNQQMIDRLEHRRRSIVSRYGRESVVDLGNLLRFEKKLFEERFWTGHLFIAGALA